MNCPKFISIIYLVIITPLSSAWAQEPSYLHFTTEDGLPSNLVYCAEQDDQGFMWFGTDQGLARFDGTRFKIYGVSEGLPDPDVLKLFKDSRGRLWLSCFQKKPCYFENGEFFTAENTPLLGEVDLSTGTYNFFEDEDGAIWVIGDNNGYCNIDSQKVLCFPNPMLSSAGNLAKAGMWKIGIYKGVKYGFHRGGWFYRRLDDNGFRNQVLKVPHYSEKPMVPKSDMVFWRDKILFLSSGSLSLLKFENGRIVLLHTAHGVGEGMIYYGKNGESWIADKKKGARKYIIDSDTLVAAGQVFMNKRINSVFQDNNLNTWGCSSDEGVFMMPNEPVYSFKKQEGQPFETNRFTCVNKLENGKMVVGDKLGNIYELKKQHWEKARKEKYTDEGIIKIVPINNEEWIAFSEKLVFDKYKKEVLVSSANVSGAIKAIATLDGQEIWIGTSHYLYKFQRGSTVHLDGAPGRVGNLCFDEDGYLWKGGPEGISSEKDNFAMNWKGEFQLLKNRIIDIGKGKDGVLWLATSTQGVLRIKVNKGKVEMVENVQDYTDYLIENIRGIDVADDGSPWVYTNHGIYHMLPDWSVEHFDNTDGLASDEVNGVAISNDTLWAATSDGLTCIPLKTEKEDFNLPVYVTGLKYDLKKEAKKNDFIYFNENEKNITLPYGASNVEVEIAGIDFQYASKINYEYIVHEKSMPLQFMTWRNLKRSLTGWCDTVILKNGIFNYGAEMSSGSQTIFVSAILPNGKKGMGSDGFILTVLPHWTNTIWFSLLLTLIVFFILRKIYMVNTEFRRIENRANRMQLQAIKAQINPHFVGNSVNAIQQFFYPPNPERASEYISIFTNLLRRSIFFAEKSFVPIEDELSFINDYLRMIELRFGKRFNYVISGLEKIEPDTPFPAMILQPILENATIHGLAESGDSILKVDFRNNGNKLNCTVTDNGPGIYISQEIKKEMGSKRKSKGIFLLSKKVATMNQLYGIDLKLEFVDLSKISTGKTGTEVHLSYDFIQAKKTKKP